MMITPRNKIRLAVGYDAKEIENTDSLFEICDAEFNSCAAIHHSFASAKGAASWARYYLLHEVRRVAMRENIYASYHIAHMVAVKIADIWFEQKETV